MRLSTAIALGRTAVTPRARVLLQEDGSGCALGMAGIACGIFSIGVNAETHFNRIPEAFPWAAGTTCEAPCCFNMTAYRVTWMTAHIFDVHVLERKDWTLDQLIDWVRSVEPAEEEAQEAKPTEIVQRGELVAVEK